MPAKVKNSLLRTRSIHYPDNDNVEDVPEAAKVCEAVVPDLEYFFHDVVEDEEDVDELESHDNVVIGIDVTQEFDRVKVHAFDDASSGRKLKHHPDS